MLDLLLFDLLRRRAFDDARLVPLIGELTAAPMRDRVPFMGLLAELAGDPRAPRDARAAALRGLVGSSGQLATEVVVQALEDPTLVDDALPALRAIADVQPWRWSHVAFHTSLEVRRAGAAGDRPFATRAFDLYLVADPALRQAILDAARASLPPLARRGLPTLLALVDEGALPREIGAAMVRRSFGHLGEALSLLRARSTASVDAFLAGVSGAAGPDPTLVRAERDDLDGLLDLALDDDDKTIVELASLPSKDESSGPRMAVACWLRILADRGRAAAMRLLFLLHPLSIGAPALAVAEVREALGIFERPGAQATLENEALQGLVASPLVRGADGALDLRTVAALLRLAATAPYASALAWLGKAALASALDERPEESAPFLFLPRGEPKILGEILDAVPDRGPNAGRTRIVAVYARQAPLDRLDFVGDRPELAAALRLVGDAALDATRAERLATLAWTKLGEAIVPGLVLELAGRGDRGPLARSLLAATAHAMTTEAFVEAFAAGSPEQILGVLELVKASVVLPFGKELALAERLAGHLDPRLRSFAESYATRPAEPSAAAPRPAAGVAFRPAPPTPSVEASVLLLGSVDPVEATDAAFLSFGSDEPSFVLELEEAMAEAYGPTALAISPLGHAWLWRWDFHALRHLDLLLAEHGDLASGVRARSRLVSASLRARATAAIASALAVVAARDRARFVDLASEGLVDALLETLGSDASAGAADALVTLAERAEIDLARLRAKVMLLLPDLDDDVRRRLARLVDARGLSPRRAPPRPMPPPDEDLLAAIRSATDPAALARHLEDARPAVVDEATLRLVELGESGLAVLAEGLSRAATGETLRPIVQSLPLWPEGAALASARARLADASAPSELRFRVAMALVERGEPGALDAAIAVAEGPTDNRWFSPADWSALLARGAPQGTLAVRLAGSPHPHAHIRAVEALLALPAEPATIDALKRFLDGGSQRMGSLRRRAAAFLLDQGDPHGFPLVVAHGLDDTRGRSSLLVNAPADLVRAVAAGVLTTGSVFAKEAALMHHLAPVYSDRSDEAYELVLSHGTTDKARIAAAQAVSRGMSRLRKLIAVSETFAWGAKVARNLLGRRMAIRMTGSRRLGFTRTTEPAIFVTPVPMLRGDRNGREVVEALILHELGHHLYHAGAEADALWAEAKKEGIGALLNLVADEHLERNLRARDASYGDRLKRLAAYAFQHTAHEILVQDLLDHLGPSAAVVLPAARLGVAKHPACVLVESGTLLFEMERAGLAFARFVRSLRMGLGNRHDDPRIAEALALFPASFRHQDMAGLLAIARKLKELFGWETSLIESVGGHEAIEGSAADSAVWGEGISQEEVDRLVERITDPRARKPSSSSAMGGGRLAINMSDDAKFDRITLVETMKFDPAAYEPYARRVERPASVLRRYFEELGIAHRETRMRTTGRRLDRSRLVPLVVSADPRALRVRERRIARDLFLGIAIDCSGSMQTRNNIERAKLFAILLAEAARPLHDVEVRAFGFTDRTIFDCGDAQRCAAHALKSTGGNNDAAALYHVASVAKRSRRRAKVLVMVSDGLPTECSVAALRALVRSLVVREGMVVAQVAVQPIAEVCFPHYVVLSDENVELTVRKFGKTIASLVRKALTT